MNIKEAIVEAKDEAATWGRPVQLHHLNSWHVLEFMKEDENFDQEWGHLSDDQITDLIQDAWDK